MPDIKDILLPVVRLLVTPLAYLEELEVTDWLLKKPRVATACIIGVILGGYIGIVHVRSVGGVLLCCAAGGVAMPVLVVVIANLLAPLYVMFLVAALVGGVVYIAYSLIKAVWLFLHISW